MYQYQIILIYNHLTLIHNQLLMKVVAMDNKIEHFLHVTAITCSVVSLSSDHAHKAENGWSSNGIAKIIA